MDIILYLYKTWPWPKQPEEERVNFSLQFSVPHWGKSGQELKAGTWRQKLPYQWSRKNTSKCGGRRDWPPRVVLWPTDMHHGKSMPTHLCVHTNEKIILSKFLRLFNVVFWRYRKNYVGNTSFLWYQDALGFHLTSNQLVVQKHQSKSLKTRSPWKVESNRCGLSANRLTLASHVSHKPTTDRPAMHQGSYDPLGSRLDQDTG